MARALSITYLAHRTGEPAERLREWHALGLLGASDQVRFGPDAEERVHLVRLFLRRGIAPEAIAQWMRSGRIERYLELLAPASERVGYFAARPAKTAARARLADPVCGMELGPAEVAARLTVEDTERVFCSHACLRRFVAAPERYGA